jgi:hypothetical protein
LRDLFVSMMAAGSWCPEGTLMNPTAAGGDALFVRALRHLEPRTAPMAPGRFWAQVAALGWGVLHQDPEVCGALLVSALPVAELVAMRLRFGRYDAQLASAISFWELQSEERIGLPVGLQQQLRAHVVGQGEIPFGLAVQGPWRVKHRADRDDYLEGFSRSFELALRSYPATALEAALLE